MARKKSSREKLGMSVYPPAEVAAAVGAFKTTELTQAIRIAAQILGQAATEVATKIAPAEWELLAPILEDRLIEPETPNPGPLIAELLEQAHSRFGVGSALSESNAKPRGSFASLVDRIRALSYPQAWALLIAVRFRRENADRLEEGAHWWELPTRWRILGSDSES